MITREYDTRQRVYYKTHGAKGELYAKKGGAVLWQMLK
jgi:hypothetical protein